MRLREQLNRIEARLDALIEGRAERQWYTIEQFAAAAGREACTVREWCRLGRVHAEKQRTGRGKHPFWIVSHAELLRYQREGLLPLAEG